MDINNTKILTQSFVHKTHYDIFKFYFPPNIKNTYCDTWIENIYKYNFIENLWKKIYSFKFYDIKIKNSGVKPRYNSEKNDICYKKYKIEMKKYKSILNKYLKEKLLL